MEVTETPLRGLKWFMSMVLSRTTSFQWVEMLFLRCSLSSSCFLNPFGASRARRSLPKRVKLSWVTSLETLRHCCTGIWPATKLAKFTAVLIGVGSGCNSVREMSLGVCVPSPWDSRWCVIVLIGASSLSRVCGWVGHGNGSYFCWSRRVAVSRVVVNFLFESFGRTLKS